MEEQSEFRVVSKFSEFTKMPLDPRENGHPNTKDLFNGTFKEWEKIRADFKEYFFMEVYLMCCEIMKDPDEAWKMIRDELPPILEKLEKDGPSIQNIDSAAYMNMLYEQVRFRVWQVDGKFSSPTNGSVELLLAAWKKQDPIEGRFRNWMQKHNTEACRDICELEDGRHVIYWDHKSLNRWLRGQGWSRADRLDMYQLQLWHEEDRDGELKEASTEEELRGVMLREQWLEYGRTQPVDATEREIGDEECPAEESPSPPRERKRQVQTVISGRIIKSRAKITKPLGGTVAEKIKALLQKAPNRRLTLKQIQTTMEQHHIVTKSKGNDPRKTFESTIRSTLSRGEAEHNFENVALPGALNSNWWVSTQDLCWDNVKEKLTQLVQPNKWVEVEFAGQVPDAAKDRMRVLAGLMTIDEYKGRSSKKGSEVGKAPAAPRPHRSLKVQVSQEPSKVESSTKNKSQNSGVPEPMSSPSTTVSSEPETPDFSVAGPIIAFSKAIGPAEKDG